MAQFGALAVGKVVDPIRMGTIEVAVGIDHLRLYPDAKLHAQFVDTLDQRHQSIREFVAVDPPIAQASLVVFACAKPTIIYHKKLYAQLRGSFGSSQDRKSVV